MPPNCSSCLSKLSRNSPRNRSNRLLAARHGDINGYGWQRDGRHLDPFFVAQASDHLENLTARGEHPPATALVIVQRAHEFNFIGRIIPLASGRIDLPAAIHLRSPLRQTVIDLD